MSIILSLVFLYYLRYLFKAHRNNIIFVIVMERKTINTKSLESGENSKIVGKYMKVNLFQK